MEWRTGIFGVFLSTVVWQDLRYQSVRVRTYLAFGIVALGVCGYCMVMQEEKYALLGHGAGIAMGLCLLGLGKVSRGGIGMGDGCFFLVSGVLLDFWENVMLLCYGTLLCGVYCMGLYGWGIWKGKPAPGKQTVPFLPFVAVPGIWLIWQKLAGG